MFKTNQILTASELLKHFKKIARLLDSYPQALLVTQRSGRHFVLLNAEIYEEILEERLASDGVISRTQGIDEGVLRVK